MPNREPRDPPTRREPDTAEIQDVLRALAQWRFNLSNERVLRRWPQFSAVFEHLDAAAEELRGELAKMPERDWPV